MDYHFILKKGNYLETDKKELRKKKMEEPGGLTSCIIDFCMF